MNILLRKYQSVFSSFLTILLLTSWVMSGGLCPSMLQSSFTDATSDCCPSNKATPEFPSYTSAYDSCDCCGCGFMQESSTTSNEIAVVGSVQTLSEVSFIQTVTTLVEFPTPLPLNRSTRTISTTSPPIHLLNQVFLN